jgi:hypothetical protein
MDLQVGDQRFEVASLGGDKMIVSDAKPLPACNGVVRVIVDGQVTVYHVELPEGIVPEARHQAMRVNRPAEVNAVA